MDSFTVIPVKLPNGAEILVEARSSAPRERDVSAGDQIWDLERLRQAIGGLAQLVQDAVAEVKPTKVAVEFGVEVSYGPGKLTTMLVNGGAKGNLKLTLEWSAARE